MKIQYKIRPEFPMGPSTVLNVPLNMGFMSGVSVQDRSQSQNHGVAQGGTGTPLPVRPGFAFTLANTHHITAEDALVTAYPISMASWVKCNSVSALGTTISIADKDFDTHWVALGHGTTGLNTGSLQSGDKAPVITALDEIDDNTWHLIGMILPEANKTTHKLYLDGVENLDIEATNSISFPSGIDRWSIGRKTISTADRYFEGTIGQCWVWTDERSDTDMRNLYELTRHKYGV